MGASFAIPPGRSGRGRCSAGYGVAGDPRTRRNRRNTLVAEVGAANGRRDAGVARSTATSLLFCRATRVDFNKLGLLRRRPAAEKRARQRGRRGQRLKRMSVYGETVSNRLYMTVGGGDVGGRTTDVRQLRTLPTGGAGVGTFLGRHDAASTNAGPNCAVSSHDRQTKRGQRPEARRDRGRDRARVRSRFARRARQYNECIRVATFTRCSPTRLNKKPAPPARGPNLGEPHPSISKRTRERSSGSRLPAAGEGGEWGRVKGCDR